MAGAFNSGFSLGSKLYQQTLDNADREARRRAEDEERALRLESARLSNDAQREAASERARLAALRQGIRDFAGGVDRQATNAALDADFNQALAASDAAVANENAVRQGVAAPAAAPAVAAAPAPMSNAQREAALTVASPVDVSSPEYRLGMNRRLADYALAANDIGSARALEGEGRQINEDSIFARRLKEYTGSDDQVAATRVYLNQNSQRISIGAPDKNGMVRLSVVRPDGEADFLKLTRQDQAKLYAAAGLMEANPTRALGMMAEVNKELAAAVAADNGLAGTLAGNANDVAGRSATISHQNAVQGNAKAALEDARKERQRQIDEQKALRTASAELERATQSGDPAAIAAARLGVLSAGGTLPGNNVTTKFEPDKTGIGGGGTVTQVRPDGSTAVTRIAGDGKVGATTLIPPPSRTTAPAPAPAPAPAAGAPKPAGGKTLAPGSYTEADIRATAQKYNMTEEQVRERLGVK